MDPIGPKSASVFKILTAQCKYISAFKKTIDPCKFQLDVFKNTGPREKNRETCQANFMG